MKKINVLVTGLALVASGSIVSGNAVAGMPTIKTQIRGDLVRDDTKGADESTSFQVPYMRFDIKGKITDDLSYRIKFRLNKTLDKDTNEDGTGSGVDYAYIQKKFDNGLKVKLGKQYINIGGYESIFSSRDAYSQGSFTWDGADFYRTAVGAFYKIGGHSFNIQAANNNEKETSDNLLFGAQALFSFVDGMINPLLSYHSDTSQNDIAVGLQVKVSALTVEVDRLVTQHDDTDAGEKVDDDKASTVFVKYKQGKWSPQFRYTVGDNDTYKDFDSYHVALEHYPYGNSSLRYHVAFSKADNTLDNTTSTKEESKTLTVGFAMSF